jgi:hypothetical protein
MSERHTGPVQQTLRATGSTYASDKHRFDDPAGFRRLDPGRPSFGREFSDSIARKIG